MDLYFTENGDIQPAPNGDFAMTPSRWRDDVQQAYIRIMTDEADFELYPTLGASLSRLFGMPQSPETGTYGATLIEAALNREGRFLGKSFTVDAVPTGPQTIRFDVFVTSGNRDQVLLSVEQSLQF